MAEERKRKRPDTGDEHARGKRLFGSLLGTLKAAKAAPRARLDRSARHNWTAAPDRSHAGESETAGQIDVAQPHHAAAMHDRKHARDRDRAAVLDRRRRAEQERELAMANFLTTSASSPASDAKIPVLYYLPRQLTLKQERIIKQHREAVRRRYGMA